MRGASVVSTVVVGAVVAAVGVRAGTARAGDGEHVPKASERAALVILTDGDGHLIAAAPTAEPRRVWYAADGARFVALRQFSTYSDGGSGRFETTFWSPRESHRVSLALAGSAWRLRCGARETELEVMPEARAAKILARARFGAPPWQRQAYALARSDDGVYYYVDRLRDEHGGKGFEVYIGKKGAMKKAPLIEVVHDSEGDIFADASRNTRLILDHDRREWVRGRRRTPLVNVPVGDNVQMIYAELGVYLGALGTPCDDI